MENWTKYVFNTSLDWQEKKKAIHLQKLEQSLNVLAEFRRPLFSEQPVEVDLEKQRGLT